MAKRLINATVEAVDVDGVVQRIDVNKLLEKVDFNILIDRIDIDRHLDRIDWNSVIDKVDVNRIIDRSNLDAIIARSSTGVCGTFLDIVRTQLVYMDQGFQRFGSLRCLKRNFNLPPKPGKVRRGEKKERFPDNRLELAVAVQGRYSGVLSRAFSNALDFLFIWVFFTMLVFLVETLVFFISGNSNFDTFKDLEWHWRVVSFLSWVVLYKVSFMQAFRHTIGMGILGVVIVRSDGSRCGFIRLLVRETMESACYSFFPLILAFGAFAWLRHDGRTPIDLLTKTGFVFHWDAKMARLRRPDDTYPDIEERRGDETADELPDSP